MENDYQKFENEDEEDDLGYEEESTEKKMKQQKIIFFSFIAFAVVSLALAFYQLKYSLKSPFFEDIPASEETGQSNLAVKKDDSFLLQHTDTDKDGLTDYDELYVYGTSPYLADSDSDGFSDKQELETKNNPNCPENKNCGLYLDKTFVASSSPPAISADSILGGTDTSGAGISGIDANLLRQTLLQAGVPADVLSQISDDTLLQEYSSIAGTSAPTATSGIQASDSLNLSDDDLSSLTPQEIRTLLESKGIDKKILDTIDDDTLKKDFLETLTSTKQ